MRLQFDLGILKISVSGKGVRLGAKVGDSYVSTRVAGGNKVGKTDNKGKK